jgi:hypothetical protein
MTNAEIITAAAIVVGPIVAVLITLWHQNRTQKRGAKERLFLTLMAHRRVMPPTFDWTNALNLIDVVFDEHEKVLEKWHEFYDIVNAPPPVDWTRWNHTYIQLLSEMAKVLGYKNLEQTQIDKFYAPQAHGTQAALNQDLQQEFLRVLRATEALQVVARRE